MRTALTEFQFPKPTASVAAWAWDGRRFVNAAGDTCDVLCYTKTDSHWSDDLTQLHEQEAGRDHPIDVASRQLALQTLARLSGIREPIVLEVGCSSGFFLEDLARQMPRVAIIGADYIAGPLRRLAPRLEGVPLLQFDLRSCPLPDASVDAIVCVNVLEHIDDHVAALREMFRVLKPGGLAHIEVPAGPRLYDIYDELLLHHRRYRMSGLKKLVAEAGFKFSRATHLGCLVFPAFAASKLRNRRWLHAEPEVKKAAVARQIRKTSASGMLKFVFRLEMALGRWLRYPCGIRCVIIAQKPG